MSETTESTGPVHTPWQEALIRDSAVAVTKHYELMSAGLYASGALSNLTAYLLSEAIANPSGESGSPPPNEIVVGRLYDTASISMNRVLNKAIEIVEWVFLKSESACMESDSGRVLSEELETAVLMRDGRATIEKDRVVIREAFLLLRDLSLPVEIVECHDKIDNAMVSVVTFVRKLIHQIYRKGELLKSGAPTDSLESLLRMLFELKQGEELGISRIINRMFSK